MRGRSSGIFEGLCKTGERKRVMDPLSPFAKESHFPVGYRAASIHLKLNIVAVLVITLDLTVTRPLPFKVLFVAVLGVDIALYVTVT